jgi:hypothetical protein
MGHDDYDVFRSGQECIKRRMPACHGGATRFPTGPGQMEIHKRLADRLAPVHQRLCRMWRSKDTVYARPAMTSPRSMPWSEGRQTG